MSIKLLRSTFTVSGMTLVSRISGLMRDIIFARLIGASASIAADSFYVAFRIPNFFRRLSGEGAFSQAFVPIYSAYHKTGEPQELTAFRDSMLSWFSLILFVMTVAGVIAAPLLIMVIAPGFTGDVEQFDLTVTMLRITFPYLFFISLVAMAAGILNTHGRFAAPAFTPVLLNVCLILAATVLAPKMERPVMALAWGVFAAGIAQLLFQVPFLMRIRALPRLRFGALHEGVKKVFQLIVPAIIGVSAGQINMLVNTLLASLLTTGSVAWLYYADRIMEFPLGIFGIALATVILPSLSKLHISRERTHFNQQLDWALRWVLLISVPATAGMIVLAQPILTTLFQYRAFTAYDAAASAQALVAFSAGLTGLILVKVLATGFYAQQNTRIPARIAAVSMIANIILSIILFRPYAHVGLAAAISISSFINSGLLFYLLYRNNVYRPESGWVKLILQTSISVAVMIALLLWGCGGLTVWAEADVWQRVWRLTALIFSGIIIYLVSLWLTGVRFGELIKGYGEQGADNG